MDPIERRRNILLLETVVNRIATNLATLEFIPRTARIDHLITAHRDLLQLASQETVDRIDQLIEIVGDGNHDEQDSGVGRELSNSQ